MGKGQRQGARSKGKGQGAQAKGKGKKQRHGARTRGKDRDPDRESMEDQCYILKNQRFSQKFIHFSKFAQRFADRCHRIQIFTIETAPRQLNGFAKGIKAPLTNTARTPTANLLGRNCNRHTQFHTIPLGLARPHLVSTIAYIRTSSQSIPLQPLISHDHTERKSLTRSHLASLDPNDFDLNSITSNQSDYTAHDSPQPPISSNEHGCPRKDMSLPTMTQHKKKYHTTKAIPTDTS